MVERILSSCQANDEATFSSNTHASSRLDHSESSDIRISVANGSVQCHNSETDRVSGTDRSCSISNGSRCEKDGVLNNKGTSALYSIPNYGTDVIDRSHKADSEENEELPVQKRPKNSSEDRQSISYPVGSCLSCAQCGMQCCQHHTTSTTPKLLHIAQPHHHSSINTSPVEIIVDRGITC